MDQLFKKPTGETKMKVFIVTAYGRKFDVIFRNDGNSVFASIANEKGDFSEAWKVTAATREAAVDRLQWKMTPGKADCMLG